jgi:hypothetical protein
MGDSRPLPSFGHVELDPGDGTLPVDSSPDAIDVDFDDDGPPPEARKAPAMEDATRIVHGDALSNITRSSGAPPRRDTPGGVTRVGEAPADLMAAARGSSEPPSGLALSGDRAAAMRELYARGDAEAALALASEITSEMPGPGGAAAFGGGLPMGEDSYPGLPSFGASPADGESGTAIVQTRLSVPPLAAMTSRRGVPRVVLSPARIAALPIDHRAGFLLAHIDGRQSMEEILDVCAMPEEEALGLLEALTAMGVIELE